MKKLILGLFTAILVASCGGEQQEIDIQAIIASGDIETLRQTQESLKTKRAEIAAQLTQIEDELNKIDKSANAALVTTHVVKDTLFQHFIELQGNVATKENVVVYPEFQGTLTRVFVKEGDQVSKGQVLGRIDDGGLGSQLSQMEVQAQLAKTTFERQERLWNQKIGSEIQYLQAKTNYEAAENTVNQMKSQVAKTAIRAPFSGVVDDVITEQGTVVAPGQPIFRIVNLRNMYIEAEVPERYLSSVSVGKEVAVNFPILGETERSKVRQTGNYINPSNRAFTIEVDVPNKKGNIKPNLTAKLKINDYTSEKALLIPLNVISENAEGEQYVYTTATNDSIRGNAIASRKIITTGKTQNGYIEVLSGLESGDAIIVEGARTVKNGQEVKIIN